MKSFAKLAAAIFAACLLSATASAQLVTYVGDIALPEGHHFIVPVNGVNSGARLVTLNRLYQWNSSTNTLDLAIGQFQPLFKLIEQSFGAFGDIDGSTPVLLVRGLHNTVFRYDFSDDSFTGPTLQIPISFNNPTTNMFAYRDANTLALTTAFSSDRFFLVDANTGAATGMGIGQVTNVGGSAFGLDGLLYVLDNPGGTYRVQSFDISTGEIENTFNIAAELATGWAGMAISSNGHLYIADGYGGGTAYDLAGNHLGDFTFTGPGTYDGNGGSFLNVDDAGNIFLYTPETGLHHYFATVPEPSVTALLIGSSTLVFTLAGRRTRKT